MIRRIQIAAFACLWLTLGGCKRHETSRAEGSSAAPGSASSMPTRADTPEGAVEAFYESQRKGDFKSAFALFSRYSIEHFGINLDAEARARSRDHFAGKRTIDHKVVEKRELGPDTVAFQVWEKTQNNEQPPETSDQRLVLRREPPGWRLNFNGLVEYRKLDVPPETNSGVSIRPHLAERFIDGTKLHFKVKNSSKRVLHWGWTGSKTTVRARFADGRERSLNGKNLQVTPQEEADLWVRLDGYEESYPTRIQLESLCFGLGGMIEGRLPDDNSCWKVSFEAPDVALR